MFSGPILVFFQKYSQYRSKAPKQCPMTTFDHQECVKAPDPGLEADPRISWLEGSISLDFSVRAPRKLFKIGDFRDTVDPKPIQLHNKSSKESSPCWISALDCSFFRKLVHSALHNSEPF